MPKQQYRDDGCNPELLEGARFAGVMELPIVERPSRIITPKTLIPFSQHAQAPTKDAFLVVYEPDVKFSDILHDPEPYTEIAYDYAGIITLEPALFAGAKLAEQIAITQRNRTLAHCFQRRCIEVIPHLRLENKYSYTTDIIPDKIAFLGIQQHSIIAINTNSCLDNDQDRMRLRLGLEATLEELKPQTVLVFGDMPDKVFANLKYAANFINYTPWPQHESIFSHDQK